MKTGHFSKFPIVLALLLTLRSAVKQIVAVDGMSGTWELLLNSTGVVAMHVALTHLNTVVLYDQTSSGRSAYHLPRGLPCPSVSTDADDRKESGCWAHSMEYDVATNTIRPLSIRTDTWCSSGSFLSDGTLEQTGGYNQGARRIRYFRPCADRNCDWNESSSTFLAEGRWYATNQVLPDGERVIIVGGLNVFSYEFIPKSRDDEGRL
ncbi:hypothetical protein HPP92_009925 [Vanilla planifolia]|uniref:Glyoxal oxidase N-terminal domain-containing protein n=1 Tax=Vanilla planifolia TaxID=51239 RepID=A0A835V7F9_VANPL|nr:hypothetical protein HPP92_009925 [Vanilla planifolia]